MSWYMCESEASSRLGNSIECRAIETRILLLFSDNLSITTTRVLELYDGGSSCTLRAEGEEDAIGLLAARWNGNECISVCWLTESHGL